MSSITTHVLDIALGRPATGVPVTLEIRDGSAAFRELARGVTDDDGRLRDLLPQGSLEVGTYRLTFDLDGYFRTTDRESFYPFAQVVFRVGAADEHYHVPLLLSPFGYSTYRGS